MFGISQFVFVFLRRKVLISCVLYCNSLLLKFLDNCLKFTLARVGCLNGTYEGVVGTDAFFLSLTSLLLNYTI
jgi:hypothetical protein